MVQELETQGYIERKGPNAGYEITNKLFLLGMERPFNKTLLEVALPQMRVFASRANQSSHIAIPVHDMIVVIARIEASSPVVLSVRVGHRQSITTSTSGIVLYAHQPPAIQDVWLDQLKLGSPEFDQAAFLADAKKARSQGFFKRKSWFMHGVTDVAFPIFRGDRAVAAVTAPCVTRIDSKERQDLPVSMLRDTAEEITNGLTLDSI